ncbi:VCBS domain-containing protein [Vibrio chagasii]|nr:VCBS domain-containing protein [Vibrio chagasii]
MTRAKRPSSCKTDTAGSYGTFNIGTDGVWTYSSGIPTRRSLASQRWDTLTETSTVTLVADGTEHDITVTINGTNDAPVIGTGDGVDAGRSDGRHQLEHGRHTDDQ